MFFKYVEGLQGMENNGQWTLIEQMLNNQWQVNKDGGESLLRYIGECWMILTDDTINDLLKGEFVRIQQNFINATKFALATFPNNSKLKFLIGYEMSISPYLFYTENDEAGALFAEYEAKGKQLLKEAAALNDDALYKFIYLGSIASTNTKDYLKLKKQIKANVDDLFADTTLIESYFRSILMV